VGDRLVHFLNQWQLINSDKCVLSVLRGSGTSVPKSTSIVISSYEQVSDGGPRQESLASRRGSHSSAERCCRISEPSSYSRFLFRLFLVPKKNGEMGPVIDLSVLNQHLMETNRSIRGLFI
jgi:hypothetical protein